MQLETVYIIKLIKVEYSVEKKIKYTSDLNIKNILV